MRRTRSLLFALACAVACGCTADDPAPTGAALLIGKWEQVPVDDPTKGEVPVPTISFGEDGSFVMEVPAPDKAAILGPPDEPTRSVYTWTLEGERDGLMSVAVTHPAGRQETMLIRVPAPNRLQVEGKSPATFRRLW